VRCFRLRRRLLAPLRRDERHSWRPQKEKNLRILALAMSRERDHSSCTPLLRAPSGRGPLPHPSPGMKEEGGERRDQQRPSRLLIDDDQSPLLSVLEHKQQSRWASHPARSPAGLSPVGDGRLRARVSASAGLATATGGPIRLSGSHRFVRQRTSGGGSAACRRLRAARAAGRARRSRAW